MISFRTSLLGTLLVFAAVGSSCSSIQVTNDFDTTVDFPAIRTARWAPSMRDDERGSGEGADIDRRRVETAITSLLPTRGVNFVGDDAGAADCWVRFAFAYRKRQTVSQIVRHDPFYYGFGCGFGPGFRGYAYPGRRGFRRGFRGYYSPAWHYGAGFGFAATDTFIREYDVERLQIEFVNTSTKKVVWWGAAEDELVADADPAARDARIRKMVGLILEQFPPRD